MRTLSTRTLLFVTFVCFGGGWIVFARSSDEQLIRQHLAAMVDAANRAPRAPVFEQLSIVREAAKGLAPQLSGRLLDGERERTFNFSRSEAEDRAFAALKSGWGELEVSVSDLSVRVEGESAEVQGEIHILGGIEGVEGKFYERWELKAGFRRSGGEWLVERVEGRDLREAEGG